MSKLAMHGWKNFLTESQNHSEVELLREIDEEEYEHIRNALNNIDPEKLPLNDMFDGKFRKVIPISAYSGDIGKLQALLSYMGYTVDFKKGIASKIISKEYEGKKRNKKIEIKINKLLNNALRARLKQKKLREEHSLARGNYFDSDLECNGYDDETGRPRKEYGECLKLFNAMKEAAENSMDYMDQIKSLYNDPGGSTESMVYSSWTIPGLKALMKVWQENASYFKNIEPGGVDEKAGEYSIVLTRHPIDVLRMSDYRDIQSCHSPPTRGGESEYWKCAIAEALDGGAVAYIVNTRELKEMEEKTGKKVEDIGGEEEVFYDDHRREGFITPISRLRMRLLHNTSDDTNLGVPEQSIYGKRIPGFYQTVKTWAAKAQKKGLADLPKDDDGKYNLSKLVKMGGTYSDSPGVTKGLANLLGVKEVDAFKPHTFIKVSGETESEVPDSDNRLNEWAETVHETIREFNEKMDYANVGGEVEDYGDGPFISAWGGAYYTIEESELAPEDVKKIREATRDSLQKVAEVYAGHLVDRGAGWAEGGSWGDSPSLFFRDGERLGRSAMGNHSTVKQIVWTMSINSGDEFGFTDVDDPDGFEYFCGEIKRDINDPFDDNGEYKKLLKAVLTQSGLLKPTGLWEFAWELDKGGSPEFSKYQEIWTVEAVQKDGKYDRIDVTTPAYYVRGLRSLKGLPEGLDFDDILEIVRSPRYAHYLKVALLTEAKNYDIKSDTIPYTKLDLYHQGSAGAADIAFEFTLQITESDAVIDTGLVDALKKIMTSFGSKDEIKDIMESAFVKTAREWAGMRDMGQRTDARKQASMEFPATSIQSRQDGAGVNYQESRRALTTESLVKNWKKFLGK